jgi:hypothetical protein
MTNPGDSIRNMNHAKNDSCQECAAIDLAISTAQRQALPQHLIARVAGLAMDRAGAIMRAQKGNAHGSDLQVMIAMQAELEDAAQLMGLMLRAMDGELKQKLMHEMRRRRMGITLDGGDCSHLAQPSSLGTPGVPAP